MATQADFVARYVVALRRRAMLLFLARAACAAAGTGTFALALAAATTGPVATPAHARLAFTAIALVTLTVLVAVARPLRDLGGTRICRLLQPVAPGLASHLRSALELAAEREPAGSSPLIAAHARSVATALAGVPHSRVAGWHWLRHRAVGLGCLGVALGAAVLTSGRAAPGLRALLQPAAVRSDGVRVAPIVTHLRARLVFPSYLDRVPAEVDDWTDLSAPRGTTVELTVTSRLPTREGTLQVGASELRLAPAGGALAASFVVRDDAELAIRVESDGHWYADDRVRRVRAVPDAPPTIALLSPESDLRIRHDDSVELRFRAGDDIGIAAVDLVRKLSGGAESRRRLWSSLAEGTPRTALDQALATTPAEEGARDGDTLQMWLEAQDGDIVTGPKRAVSRTVTIEVIARDRRAALEAPRLRTLLDQGLAVLADRLEEPVPDVVDAAARRAEELRAKTEAWLAGVDAFAVEAKDLRDRDRIQGISTRTRRLLDREEAVYRAGGGHAQHVEHDGRLVEEHERDVLLLADLLGEALVGEARDLTNDLAQAAAEMRRLLDQLRSTDDAETRRALLAEIANAERRLMDLARSLSEMATRVPSDFVNREAVERSSSRSALDSLRDAVQAGDLEAAMKHLDSLAREFDQLAQQIESGQGRYRDARFGPEDAAYARARQQLDSLASAQDQLAQRSGEMVRKLGERAGTGEFGDDARRRQLQAQAEAIERDLQRVPEGAVNARDERMLGEARQRARDTSDALRTGDLGEARRNAARTGQNLEQLAPDMRGEAGMFPGHQGETAKGAEAVDSALSKLGELRRQLDDAAPKLDPHAGEGERAQMRGDAKSQGDLQSSAEALQQSFGGEPGSEPGHTPGGKALSPSAARELKEASERMARAREALEQGRAEEASLAQEDASRRLRELGKQLDGQSQGGAQPGEQQSKREGGDGGLAEGPVRIPGADEFRGPEALRRRLLDAMREASPPGYEHAVGRYYEELLR